MVQQPYGSLLHYTGSADGSLDLARSEAAGADFCLSHLAVFFDPYGLDVRIPLSSGVSVGVGYVIAGNLSFSANLTLS